MEPQKTMPYFYGALALVLLIAALIGAYGVRLCLLPPIYQATGLYAAYEGPVLVMLALAMLVLARRLATRLLLLVHELHRLLSALLVMAALAIDGLMHLFNIPHMEGWWIPVVGSGAVLGSVMPWLRQWRKHRHCADRRCSEVHEE